MLAKYIAAEQAVLDGKSVSFAGRSLTMENLKEIRDGRKEWEAKVKAEQPQEKQNTNKIGGLNIAQARFDQ